MKNMKRILALLLAMVFVLSACSGKGGDNKPGDGAKEGAYTGPKELTEPTSREVQTMDYTITALASDHEINANLVDGLLENDNYGKLKPALATEWSSNDDKTVWTFKLREGAKWVTNSGEEYDTVKAEDFVTGLRHVAEFESANAWLLKGVIKGFTEYIESDLSDAAWEKVGIKAKDDLTVEYTLEAPVPYFDSITTYTVLYPINKSFLESKGAGCKLGSPKKQDCKFGTIELDSILYNGGYILTTNDAKSKAVLTKNENYWDAENVFLEKVTRIYDAGEDPYSSIKGFEQGTYPSASLQTTWEDYDKYLDKYKDNAFYSLPNNFVFGIVFNYGRQKFDVTKYAQDETQRENTRKAKLNENFRKAVRAAFDRVSYLSIGAPKDLAVESLRNINNFPGAGTLKDGTQYYDLVNKEYNQATGENVDLHDGQDPFYGKEQALAYIEKAKAEGVQFPVQLDIIFSQTSPTFVKRGQSMKKSIEDNTDGQIVINLHLLPQEQVTKLVYQNDDPKTMDYDISVYTGWGADYQDPKSFVEIYSPLNGYYMRSLGLGTVDDSGKVQDLEIKESLGLMEYQKLFEAADKIVDDMDARYKAFAKADAYLLERAIYVPTSQQTRGQLISKRVPFSRLYADTGVTEQKYKGLKLQENLVTKDEYEKAFKEWSSHR